MLESQISSESTRHAKHPRIQDILYGRGSAMDRTFRYLSSHGFVTVGLAQAYYKLLCLLRDYTFSGKAAFDLYLFPIPMRIRLNGTYVVWSIALWRDAYVQVFRSDIRSWKRARWVAIGILMTLWMFFWLAILFIGGAILRLPQKIAVTAFRCWSTTLTTASRSVPILIATLVILFTTGDAWRLYGSESTVRFEILTIIILTIGIIAMIIAVAQVEDGWRHAADGAGKSAREFANLVKKTPAEHLAKEGITPIEITGTWYSKWVRRNARFMFWFTIIGSFFSVALITFVVFMFIGIVAVSSDAAKDLLRPHSVDVIWNWTILGQSFVSTRPLLLLSILFGSIAALTFATVGLQDERSLNRFMQLALLSHRRSLSALAYYVGSITSLEKHLSWQAVCSELRAHDRSAILDVFQMMVEQSRPRVISAVFNLARNHNLRSWAGSQGIAILNRIPDRKLVKISTESREFVLASAAVDPAKAAVIRSIRQRAGKLSSITR
jgi:hypothetical protein